MSSIALVFIDRRVLSLRAWLVADDERVNRRQYEQRHKLAGQQAARNGTCQGFTSAAGKERVAEHL